MADVAIDRERWAMSVEARALALVSAMLFAFGLAVLYSASAMDAVQRGEASSYWLLRQLIGGGAAVVAFAIAAKFDAEQWQRWAWPIMGLSIFLMVLVLIPGIGVLHGGSRRFLLGRSLQPSEFAKIAVVMWTARLVVKKGDALRRLTKGLLPFLLVIGGLMVLAVLEPDLSVAMMFGLLMAIVLFAGGVRIGHFVFLGIIGIPVLWKVVEKYTYQLLRLLSYFDPATIANTNRQLWQSLIAVGSGGVLGQGYGQGMQQYGWVSMGFTDFIGSNIGEEWGFIGLSLVVVAFGAYAFLGFRIARNARSQFQALVAIGLTVTVVLTAYVHIGVVIGLLPTTGLTLPFVSSGRSNLVVTFFMTGVLVNIGSVKQVVRGHAPPARRGAELVPVTR